MSQGSIQILSRFTLQYSFLSLFKDFLLVPVQSVERFWNLHVFMGVKLSFSHCSVCANWYRAEQSQRDMCNLPREESVQMVAVLFFFFLLEPGNRTGYLLMLLLMLSNWHTDCKLLWKCMRLEGVVNITERKWFKWIKVVVMVSSFSLTGEQWFSFE